MRKKAKKNYFLSFSASFTYGVFLHSHLSLGHLPIVCKWHYSALNPCCSISKLAQRKGPMPLASLSRIGSLI